MKVLIIIGAVLALAVPPAIGGRSVAEHYYVARVGDSFAVPSVDLYCSVFRHDPDGHESGPLVICYRSSVKGGRSTEASRYHYIVSDESGSYIVYRVGRTP